MHKMQVEEMRDFFSQKYTFGKVSEILQARHPCIRGYSVKSIFLRKKQKQGISFGISHLLQMMCLYKIYFFEL